MTTTQQPAPDYGEPWQLTTDFAFDIKIRGELAASFDKIEHANRAISCVNACAGMADPAAEVQAMREAIEEAFAALDSDALWAFDNTPPKELEARWLDGKGSSTSGPNNCLAFFERRKSALAKLQPFLKP